MGEDGCCGGRCGCGAHDEHVPEEEGMAEQELAEEQEEDELSTDDLAESNQIILSALVEVLQRKGVLTQQELDAEIESIQAEDDDDEEDRDEESDEATPAPAAPPVSQ